MADDDTDVVFGDNNFVQGPWQIATPSFYFQSNSMKFHHKFYYTQLISVHDYFNIEFSTQFSFAYLTEAYEIYRSLEFDKRIEKKTALLSQ